jgi:hypothetical protein
MAWKITKDHSKDMREKSRVGIGQGQNAPDEQFTYEFCLKDDDGNLCYSGLIDEQVNGDESEAFAPLDFAGSDVGATTMEYRPRGSNGEWQTL